MQDEAKKIELLTYYRNQGLCIIPLEYGTKKPIVKWTDFQKRKPTDEEFGRMYADVNKLNFAVVCGGISDNHIVLDFESEELAREIFPDLEKLAQNTLVVRTARGIHIHLKMLGELPKIAHISGKMDLLSDGSLAILPPSLHPSGAEYRLFNNNGGLLPKMMLMTQADFDKLLVKIETVSGHKVRMQKGPVELKLQGVGQGGRNNTAFDIARKFKYHNHTIIETMEYLKMWNSKNVPPMDEKELEIVVKSVYKDMPTGDTTPKTSYDMWLEETAKGVKDKLFRTILDNTGQPKTIIDKSMARDELSRRLQEYYPFASFIDTQDTFWYDDKEGIYKPNGEQMIQSLCQKVADKSTISDKINSSFVNEVVTQVKRSTFLNREDFEAPLNFICLQNGILDVATDQFMPYAPDKRFLTKVPVTYVPSADCPKFKKFLSEVLPPETIPLVFEFIGYTLYREYFIQKTFMLIGKGNNGKSTLLRVIERFVGKNNCTNISLHDLETERFAKAYLYGKMLNQYADLSSEELNTTTVFKMLTGGDSISAEFKNKPHFNFVNYAKLIFSCNNLPATTDTSDAFFRRWVIIDFAKQFDGKLADKMLIHKLTTDEEMSGILNEALIGLKRILADQTFSNEKSTEEIRDRYIRSSDSVAAFVMDEIDIVPAGFVPKQELYECYLAYCAKQRYLAVGETKFFRRLISRVTIDDYRPKVAGRQVYCWRGIEFRNRPNYTADQETY